MFRSDWTSSIFKICSFYLSWDPKLWTWVFFLYLSRHFCDNITFENNSLLEFKRNLPYITSNLAWFPSRSCSSAYYIWMRGRWEPVNSIGRIALTTFSAPFFLIWSFLTFVLVVVFLCLLLGQRYRCVRNRRVCILRLPNAISLTTGFSTCACACPWKCVRRRVCVRHKGKKLTPPVRVCVCRFGENTCLSPSSTSVDKLSFICVFVQVFFRVA